MNKLMAMILLVILAVAGCGGGAEAQGAAAVFDGADGWSETSTLDPASPGVGFRMSHKLARAQVTTVQFSIVTADGAAPPNATATVRWFVGESSVTRTMSVGQGATISGVADAVEVSVVDETAAAYAPAAIPADARPYSVTAAVAPMPRPYNAAPPSLRHFPAQVNAPPGFTAIPVPQNCGVNSAYVSWANLPAGVAMGFAFMANGAVIGTYESSMFAPMFVPMPPGTDTLMLTNASAGPIAAAIEWGIDG